MTFNSEHFLESIMQLRNCNIRIHWSDDRKPYFDAAAILKKAGFANVEKGTIRHLKGCPSESIKVRVIGRGYPFRRFVDTDGAMWVLNKANHRDIQPNPEDEFSEGATKEERQAHCDRFKITFQQQIASRVLEFYDELMRTEATTNEIAICRQWIEEHKEHKLKLGIGGLFSEEGQKSFMLFSRAGFAEDVIKGGPKAALNNIWVS